MNLKKTYEQQKQSKQQSAEHPSMSSLGDTETEIIMGAIRTLDNQQKKEALMQAELEQAHLRLVKHLEALQTECRAALSKQEEVLNSTCRALLENAEKANQSILKQNETLLKLRAEEFWQNREVMNLLDFLKLFGDNYILEVNYMYDNRRFLVRNRDCKGAIGILPFTRNHELSYDGWNGEHFDEFAQERPYLNIDIRDCAAVNVDNERKKIQVFITEETPEI